jgi:hypothetical protein
VIDPRGLNVMQWCHAIALDLSGLTTIPILQRPEDWERWATSVASSPELSVYHPPDPRYFNNWEDWAVRFVQAVPI